MRTVGVRLKAQISEYVREMRTAKSETTSLKDELVDAAKKGDASATAISKGAKKAEAALDDLGDAADDAGDELAELRRKAAELDGQIGETTLRIRDLAREIVTTSDKASRAKLLGDLKAQRGELRDLLDLRKTIGVDSGSNIGEVIAEQASVTFVQRFGPLVARLPLAGSAAAAPAAAIGAPIAVGVASLVSTAVGGAIVGGVGIGGVIGGVTLASRNPIVKAKATSLGADLGRMLGSSASAFVPATVDAIDTVRDRLLAMEPDFRRLFNSASHYVDPLVDGLLDATENAMPGFIDAVEHAGPVIRAIAEGAADLGDALGDGLSDLAPYADEGARALDILFWVIEGGLRTVFTFIAGMSELYSAAEIVGAILSGDTAKAVRLVTQRQNDAKTAGDGWGGSLDHLRGLLEETGDEAGTAGERVLGLKEAFDELFGQRMSYDEALLAYKQGLADLHKELRDGKRTLDDDTQAGRDNIDAVLDQIGTIEDLREARLANGESLDVVNGKYADELDALKATLRQMGFNEAEIEDLVGKYETIPDEVSTTIIVKDKDGNARIEGFKKKINTIDGRVITVTARFNAQGDLYIPGQGKLLKNRFGGLYEHAAVGALRDAHIASPVGNARYAYAEQATGGELFAPKHGDLNRTKALVGYAVENWWGGWQNFAPPQPVPVPVGGSSAPPEVRVFIGDRELTDIVRVEISEHSRDLKRRALAGPEMI